MPKEKDRPALYSRAMLSRCLNRISLSSRFLADAFKVNWANFFLIRTYARVIGIAGVLSCCLK